MLLRSMHVVVILMMLLLSSSIYTRIAVVAQHHDDGDDSTLLSPTAVVTSLHTASSSPTTTTTTCTTDDSHCNDDDDDDKEDASTSPSSILTFLVCSVDGSIAIVDALTGAFQGLLETNRPLVAASVPHHVVPGLDGRLYQYTTSTSTTTTTSSEQQDDDEPELQVLPMTVFDVLGHPVRTCTTTTTTNTKNHDETSTTQSSTTTTLCGIVTGTKLTHLYAWNPHTRLLEWTQQPPPTTHQQQSHEESTSSSSSSVPPLLLQREDFVVRHISTVTGKEEWNVTLGRFTALDFDHSPRDHDDESTSGSSGSKNHNRVDGFSSSSYLPATTTTSTDDDNDEEYSTKSSTKLVLPSIAFGKNGKTLTAIGSDGRLLWKRQWHAVVASVYGVRGYEWVPLQVVDDDDELMLLEQQQYYYYKTTDGGGLLLPSTTDGGSGIGNDQREKEEKYLNDLLWNELQQLAGRSHRPSDVVLYPEDMHGWYYPSRSAPHYDCVRDASSGVCVMDDGTSRMHPQQLLLGSGQDPPLPSPSTNHNGVFVSWNMVAGLMGLMVVGVWVLRLVYIRKKRHWLDRSSNTRSTILPTSKVWKPQHRSMDPTGRLSSTVSTTTLTRRHTSLPGLNGAFLARGEASVLQRPVEETNTAASPTTATASSSAPEPVRPHDIGHIDGIPLVRYSRYQSEFRELSPLGRGGFGSVFRCVNQLDGREYAIKKIHIQSEIDAATGNVTKEFSQRLQRVLREVKILALLDHVNIVRYYTAWLELEEDKEDDPQNDDRMTNGEYSTQDDSKFLSRCYSSELLTGASTADRRPPSSPHGERHRRNNPLGWNNFPNDFDESLRGGRTLLTEEADCGFTFEASESGATAGDDRAMRSPSVQQLPVIRDEGNSSSSSDSASSCDSSASNTSVSLEDEQDADTTKIEAGDQNFSTTGRAALVKPAQVRHTLYIQMQLCSQKTLGDFLSNPDSRKGRTADSIDGSVDIPCALGLFHQVAQGVQHVHEQGLIHRDLKPSNCFMDDAGVVKVGDFGLSRESSAGAMDEEEYGLELEPRSRKSLGADENTAGVGTRSYASPEQMSGSDYDASTDVYSLGIMLFELCYPMYTGMERHIVFSGLRELKFPDEWMNGAACSFPTVHSLLLEMLSSQSPDRPSAKSVARHIESLLGEFTILSLDRKRHSNESSIWLRVEAEDDHGVLPRTMSVIQLAAPRIRILQYGLRGHEQTEGRTAIMEFALALPEEDQEGLLREVLEKLRANQDIQLVRQISGAARRYEF